MERVLVNKVGQVQRRTLGGREFLVAPVTMIVPSVLSANRGPVYYPPEELSKAVHAWNGMPIVLNHPMKDGQPISARDPEVLERSGIGTVFNARVLADGSLAAEAWFDIQNANRIDKRIVSLLETNQKIEVSTGLGIDLEEANAVHNGTAYLGIARAHKPDHLALLLDHVGACSIQRGCGVNNETIWQKLVALVNGKQEQPMKKELVDYLTANCDCWKGQADTLNAMSEEQLTKLKTHVEEHVKLVANSKQEEPKKETPVAPVLNVAGLAKQLAPHIGALVSNAVAEATERKPLVERLLANVKAEERAAKEAVLIGKSVAELKDMVSFLPPVVDLYPRGGTYLGNAAPVTNEEDEADVVAMLPPVTNYAAQSGKSA